MTAAQRRYVATEGAIGAAISAALSIVFVLLLFGGMDRVPVRDLIVDALPQGFAIALMATLVPTLLTRRRLARGTVAPVGTKLRVPRLLPRALLVALFAATAGAALTTGLWPMGIAELPLAIVLIGKAVWGLLLGIAVAATMTFVALTEGVGARSR